MSTVTMPKRANVVRSVYFGWIRGIDFTGKDCGSTCVRGDTIPQLIADVFKTAAFRMGVGRKATLSGLVRACAECDGHGDVPVKSGRLYKRKQCKVCKGVGEFERFEDIELTVGESTIVCDTSWTPNE